MVDSFPVLTLAYYLRERETVEAYIQRQEAIAEEIRRENEARFPTEGLRERFLALTADKE